MRKFLITALTLGFIAVLATAAGTTSLIAQEQEQTEPTYEGSLQVVDLENMEIVIADANGSEITLLVSSETAVSGPEGPLTLEDLPGREGSGVVVHALAEGETIQAVSIELLGIS